MTSQELIERLQKMPGDAEVVIDKDLLVFPYESNQEKVTDLYPSPDGKTISLAGEG